MILFTIVLWSARISCEFPEPSSVLVEPTIKNETSIVSASPKWSVYAPCFSPAVGTLPSTPPPSDTLITAEGLPKNCCRC